MKGFRSISSECDPEGAGTRSESDAFEEPLLKYKRRWKGECEMETRVTTGIGMGSPITVRAPFIQIVGAPD